MQGNLPHRSSLPLLRKDEGDEVEGVFGPNGQFDLNFIRVNAQQRYYDKLACVSEPEASIFQSPAHPHTPSTKLDSMVFPSTE